jgi:tetratricopeptide (TPR) repeat protein
MSNLIQPSNFDSEPFEDRIDNLFRELELAIKWQRPSVLYSIYKSEYVRDEVEALLGERFEGTDQKLVNLDLQSNLSPDFSSTLLKITDMDKSVICVNGLNSVFVRDENSGASIPAIQEEFFIENNIRIVFWLTVEEAASLARTAPDYWSLRHRVLDFTDDPTPEQVIKSALEKIWKEAESPETGQILNEIAGLNDIFVSESPTSNELISIYGNLLLKLGILHWRRQDYDKAYEHLQIALDIAYIMRDNDFGAECLYAIALVNTGLGKENEAIYAYESALDLAPGQKLPWNTLGHLYTKLNRNSEAHSAFQRAIEEDPKDPISWNGLGIIFSKIERFDDAISAFQKAIEFAPNFVHPWNGLGDVYTTTGQIDEAITSYENAIRLNNKLTNPWIGLGNIFLKQKRIQDAIQALEKAIAIDENSFHAWSDLGDIYLKTASYDEAIQAYSKAIELAPNFGWPYRNLASAFISTGRFAEAVPLLKKSIDLLNSSTEKAISFNKLGDAYRNLSDYQAALDAYQQADALSATPTDQPVQSAAQGLRKEYADLSVREPEQEKLVATDLDPVKASLTASPDQPASSDTRTESAFPEEETVVEAAAAESELVVAGEEVPALEAVSEEVKSQLEAAPYRKPLSAAEEIPAVEVITLEAQPTTIDPPIAKEVAERIELIQAHSVASDSFSDTPDETSNEKETSQDTKSAFEWNGLGNTFLKAGSYDEAISAYTKAIETAHKIYWPYIHNLALAHYQKGRYSSLTMKNIYADNQVSDNLEKVALQKVSRNMNWRETSQNVTVNHQKRNTKSRPNPNYLLARARYLLASNSRG